MKPIGVEGRHHAASVLFVLAWLFWFHHWVPAAAVVTFLLWAVLHRRLEAGLADVLAVRWRRAWRSRLLAITLLSASALLFARADAAVEAKVVPIALDAVAVAVILVRPRGIPVPYWLGGDLRVTHAQRP